MAKSAERSAKDVIDAAVIEGARWERTCFAFVLCAGLLAFGVMIAGAVLRDGLVALGGGVGGSGMVASLLAYTNAVRRDKVRVRLYEIALAKATTAEEAAKILREALNRPARGEKPS